MVSLLVLKLNQVTDVDANAATCLPIGLVLLAKNQPDQGSANSLPVTLFPTRYPRKEFDYAVHIQKDFNILVNSVANDLSLLKDSLKE